MATYQVKRMIIKDGKKYLPGKTIDLTDKQAAQMKNGQIGPAPVADEKTESPAAPVKPAEPAKVEEPVKPATPSGPATVTAQTTAVRATEPKAATTPTTGTESPAAPVK